MARNNNWLATRLASLHQEYFSDIKLANTILVRFGRQSKTRLGSIKLKKIKNHHQPVSLITINKLLQLAEVPDYVIDAVLAHELVHYCHGFSSPLPRLYRYPHQAGVVDKELKKRGLNQILQKEKRWTKQHFAKLWLSNT